MIAPVRFGMPVSDRARTELRRQRADEAARIAQQIDPLKAWFETRIEDAENLTAIKTSRWPRNARWSDDEYRFREYVKVETELLEKRDAVKADEENLTQREVSAQYQAIDALLSKINKRQRELMQGFSVAALDRMTGWLSGNARFRTQSDEDLARHFRRTYTARN